MSRKMAYLVVRFVGEKVLPEVVKVFGSRQEAEEYVKNSKEMSVEIEYWLLD